MPGSDFINNIFYYVIIIILGGFISLWFWGVTKVGKRIYKKIDFEEITDKFNQIFEKIESKLNKQ